MLASGTIVYHSTIVSLYTHSGSISSTGCWLTETTFHIILDTARMWWNMAKHCLLEVIPSTYV